MGEPASETQERAANLVGSGDRAFAALAGFAAFALMLILPTALRDGDTGWHLAAGEWILRHGRVPPTDPFSFTAAGRPWVAHEWLSEIVMHAAYRAGGWSGLILLFGVALAALYAIVALFLTRRLGLAASAAALLLITAGLLPSLLARPHLLALPLLAAWTVAMLDARGADRRPGFGWATLMLIWANAHGSFVLGLGIAALFGLEAVVSAPAAARMRAARNWGAFGLLSLAAALLTPHGVHGFTFPLYVSRLGLLSHLSEWQPANFATFSGLELILLATLFVLLARPTRIAPFRLALLLGLLHLALQHTRQDIVLVVVGALLLADPVAAAWHRPAAPPRSSPPGQTGAIAIVLVLAAGLAAARLAVPVERTDSPTVPATAMRRLPAELREQRVFNEYSFGGSLILAGIRPYIDGRSDMYGDPFTLDYFRIAAGDAARWRAADAAWQFRWTMLPPKSRLLPLLDADPRWRRAYADDQAVIHVRARP